MQVGDSVVFAGYTISNQGILPIAERTAAIRNYPTPTCTKELKDKRCQLPFRVNYLKWIWGENFSLTEVAGEGGPDLAPQKFLSSQKFRHLMG